MPFFRNSAKLTKQEVVLPEFGFAYLETQWKAEVRCNKCDPSSLLFDYTRDEVTSSTETLGGIH